MRPTKQNKKKGARENLKTPILMAEANENNGIGDLLGALNRALRAYNRAGSAITPDQENSELRNVGNNLVVLGAINTGFAYRAFINLPVRNLAYAIPTYMLVIPLVIQCFTIITGITAVVIGWLLIVSDNPRQYYRLLNVILLLVLIASSFTIGMLV